MITKKNSKINKRKSIFKRKKKNLQWKSKKININNKLTKYSRVQKGGVVKDIKHFWYREWPDHGAPNLNDVTIKKKFIEFVDILLDDIRKDPGGTVIHCSAGVGRTGTIFVILKICLDKGIKYFSDIKPSQIKYQDVTDAITYARKHRQLSLTSIAISFPPVFK